MHEGLCSLLGAMAERQTEFAGAGWVVSSLVLGVYLGGIFAKRLPMANQLIYAIRDTRRFTEHEATSSAYELFEHIERVPYVDAHFLQNFVG